jgi:hypothetical protein
VLLRVVIAQIRAVVPTPNLRLAEVQAVAARGNVTSPVISHREEIAIAKSGERWLI